MVGYAYSFDSSTGYNNILIKAYDSEDISFVNSSSYFELYRVKRDALMVQRLLPRDDKKFNMLSLKHIEEIKEMLILEEFDRNYPATITWAITPSGNCHLKSAEDYTSFWPVNPVIMQSESAYINISDICFDKPPTYLEASFTAQILCESAYLCGIYSSDLFSVCGNNIFCSADMVCIEHKIFGTSYIKSMCGELEKTDIPKISVSTRAIVSSLEKLSFEPVTYRASVREWIVNIKNECIKSVSSVIKNTLIKKKSFRYLLRRIRYEIKKSLDNLGDIRTEFISVSNTKYSTDMNYLSFDEVLMAFTFADCMRDIPKNIRKNKERFHNLKKLTPPCLICDGRLYYKRQKEQ